MTLNPYRITWLQQKVLLATVKLYKVPAESERIVKLLKQWNSNYEKESKQ